MENKLKHLEMIQGVINRMANNSFMLKGWTVTLIAGIFVLSDQSANKLYFLIAFVPIITFWLLDSYYLYQERLYRGLYEYVRLKDENDIDFSLKATHSQFGKHKKPGQDYWLVVFSKTEFWFYMPLLVACIGILVMQLLGLGFPSPSIGFSSPEVISS